MTLKEAIEILKTHNEWRRWKGVGPSPSMQSPYKIGEAVDVVVANYKRKNRDKTN